jgi:MFS family permease
MLLSMLNSALISRLRLPGGRPFALLLASLAVSSCGDWLYNVALLALVDGRTGSATWVALTTAARVLPVVVLGPLGGVLADRHDRRRLMIGADVVRALLMVALAAVAVAGLPIVLAPVLAAAATACSAVTPPCVAACTPRFVPAADLQRANALRAAIGQAAIVVGPALGALVLLLSTPATAILLNGLTFLASAAAIAAIGRDGAFAASERTAGEAAPSVIADIRAGAQALRGAPAAMQLVAGDILCSGVYGALTVTLVMVSRRAGAGDDGYGLLMGAFGIGGVVGATVIGRLSGPARWRPALGGALALVALVVAGLGIAPGLVVAGGLALLGGGGMIVGEVLSDTALPQLVDGEVLGRAYGLAFPASISGIVVGALVAGPLVSLLGLSGAMVAIGAFVLIAAAVLLHRPLQTAAVVPAPAVG